MWSIKGRLVFLNEWGTTKMYWLCSYILIFFYFFFQTFNYFNRPNRVYAFKNYKNPYLKLLIGQAFFFMKKKYLVICKTNSNDLIVLIYHTFKGSHFFRFVFQTFNYFNLTKGGVCLLKLNSPEFRLLIMPNGFYYSC